MITERDEEGDCRQIHRPICLRCYYYALQITGGREAHGITWRRTEP